MSLARNLSNKHRKLLATGLDALKTASKKLIHKAAEATGKFIGNKIAEKNKTYNWWKFKKKNCIKRWTLWNVYAIKWFNCVKMCDKKVNQSKWFIKWPIFC